jgi:hypothetical protein
MAIQLIHRIHKVFSVDLSLRASFEMPTVAGMTAAVARRNSDWSSPLVPGAKPAEVEVLSPKEARHLVYKSEHS